MSAQESNRRNANTSIDSYPSTANGEKPLSVATRMLLASATDLSSSVVLSNLLGPAMYCFFIGYGNVK